MTDSPQAATAAAPADAPADEESLYQATMQALDAPENETSTVRKAALLIGTLALSVVAFLWLGFSLLFLLILIGVLLFHELGHYLGMQLFGYRDVRMFFIPFLGAAVSGRKHDVPVWQKATVLLLGPLPGLALAAALYFLYEPPSGSEQEGLVWLLIAVNTFSLLPVKPLDGGRLIDILFARRPYLAAGFQLLAGCALAAYAWLAQKWWPGYIAVVLLLDAAYRATTPRGELHAESLELPDKIERLDEAQRRLLFARAVQRAPQDRRDPTRLAAQLRAVYERTVARHPSLLAVVLILALYLSGFAVPTVVLYDEWLLVDAETAEREGLSASTAGKHDEALAGLQKALAIRQAYVARRPARVKGRYALSRSYKNLARQMRAAQPAEAVKHLRAALSILEDIETNRAKLGSLHLSLAFDLAEAGGHAEAVEHLRKAAREIVAGRPYLGIELDYIRLDLLVLQLAPALLDLGRESEALDVYRADLAVHEKDASDIERTETSEKRGKPGPDTAAAFESVSKRALLARDFAKALSAAERSLSLAPGNRQVEAYRAHALMLLDRADEAKTAYQAHKGQPAVAGKTWAQVVSEDFASLKRAGLAHPMMAEIEKLLGPSAQQ